MGNSSFRCEVMQIASNYGWRVAPNSVDTLPDIFVQGYTLNESQKGAP